MHTRYPLHLYFKNVKLFLFFLSMEYSDRSEAHSTAFRIATRVYLFLQFRADHALSLCASLSFWFLVKEIDYCRYRVLMRSTEITRNNYRKTCETVLARLIPEVDKYQPGKTKIFFRAGQVRAEFLALLHVRFSVEQGGGAIFESLCKEEHCS